MRLAAVGLLILSSFFSSLTWGETAREKVFIENGTEPTLTESIGDFVGESAKSATNFLLKSFGESPLPESEVEYIYYDRIPNSPYLIAQGKLYWERREIQVKTCTFCTRSNVTSTTSTKLHYHPVEGDFEMDNLIGFGPNTLFITDLKQMIHRDKVISEVIITADFDPHKYYFAHVRGTFFIVDNLVFLQEKYLPINGREFEYIADYLYKDAQYVYDKGQILEGADPKTFTMVNQDFAQDKYHVWRNNRRFELTDIQPGLQRLDCQISDSRSCYYAKNEEQVFYRDKVIEGADPETFEVLGLSCPKDPAAFEIPEIACSDDGDIDRYFSCISEGTKLEKQYTEKLFTTKEFPYLQCHVPSEIDRRQVDEAWARDKNRVYHYHSIEPQFNPETTQMMYLSSQLFVLDDQNLVKAHYRERTTYQDFLAGPLTKDSWSNSQDILLADAKGFFEFDNLLLAQERGGRKVPSTLCDYSKGQEKGDLSVIKNPPEGIAYAFEDDLFEYYFKGAFWEKKLVSPSEAPKGYYKTTEDVLWMKDYIIEKATGIQYVMFDSYMQCGSWDEVKASAYYLNRR